MYPEALKWGISCFDFWEMSLKEISDTIMAQSENERQRLIEKARFDYAAAKLMTYAVHAPSEMPCIEEIYPITAKKRDTSQDWKIIKAQVSAAGKKCK